MADTANSKNTIQSLAKGFRVLESFSAQEPQLTMAQVARAAGVDNATAFRFLNTLVDLGYVQRVPNTRLFELSTKVLNLGFNAIAHADLRTLARPVLRKLVGQTNEAASIGVLENAEIIYAERIQAGLTRLGVDIRIGSRVPVHSTAIGHAILSSLPESEQRAILDARPRQKLTEKTLVDIEALLARLQQVRQRGYALSDQETVSGLYVIAAPILDADGIPLAALSVAAPALNTTLPQFEQLAAPSVMDAAQSLSHALQATGGVISPR